MIALFGLITARSAVVGTAEAFVALRNAGLSERLARETRVYVASNGSVRLFFS
jgi:hypothetical protein